jgi:hypothetical protein
MIGTRCRSGSMCFSTMKVLSLSPKKTWWTVQVFTRMSQNNKFSIGSTGIQAYATLQGGSLETMLRITPTSHLEAWRLSGHLLGIGCRRAQLKRQTMETETVIRSRQFGTPTRRTNLPRTGLTAESRARLTPGGSVLAIPTMMNGLLVCQLLSLQRRGRSIAERILCTATQTPSALSHLQVL